MIQSPRGGVRLSACDVPAYPRVCRCSPVITRVTSAHHRAQPALNRLNTVPNRLWLARFLAICRRSIRTSYGTDKQRL